MAAIVAATMASKVPVAAAQAQEQTQPPAPAPSGAPPQNLEEVTVTGSRIKRTSDYTAPTPTTVLDSTVLDNLGVVNLGQALKEIPANLSQFTPANTANSSFFTGSFLADLRGLNPFFGSRTLTLIDTKRAVQTNQGDGFDLNFIPQLLVQRVDTVTGGASAAYGSGAISGVVNVIMDRKLEGAKLNGDIYETNDSDGQQRHLGAAWGHGFMDDRVHVVLGAEYEHDNQIGCQNARTWCAADKGFYQSGVAGNTMTATYSAGEGLHNGITGPAGVFFPQGLVPGPGSTALQVTPDGTNVIPYSTGVIPPGGTPSNTSTYLGGDGPPNNQFTSLYPELARGVITGMVTAKITDDINMKVDLNWGKVTSNTGVGGSSITPLAAFGVTNITPANAFIQSYSGLQSAVCPGGFTAGTPYVPATATTPAVAPVLSTCVSGSPGVALSKQFLQVPLEIHTDTNVKRFTVGFDGKIPGSSWNWETYLEYGKTHREQLEPNEIRAASASMALDSVIGPNGQPMCRVTAAAMYAQNTNYIADVLDPTNPYFRAGANYDNVPSALGNNNALAAGCVPLNPFGTNAVPSDSLAYSFGNLDEKLRYSQTVAAINASGDVFNGIGAGAFSMALGFEWRQEQGFNDEVQSCLPQDAGVTGPAVSIPGQPGSAATADTCTLRSQDFAAQFGTPFAGSVTVDEAFGELNLPLAKNLPFAHAAELDLAGRFSRYDNKQLLALEQNPADPTGQSLIPASGLEATHNLVTYKFSGFYEPIDGIRLRASQSHDSRAANLRELYYAQQLLPFSEGGFGTCSHPGLTPPSQAFSDSCFWNLLGNLNLAPETSDTTTFGIVLTPPQLPGLQFSADFFHLKISNAIEQASIQQVEVACNSATAAACKQMSFNNDQYDVTPGGAFDCTNPGFGPGGMPNPTFAGCATDPLVKGATAWAGGALNATGINATSFNGAFYDENGIDFSLTYTQPLPDNSVLTFRTLATYTGLQKFQTYPGGPVQDILGQVGGIGILGDFTPAPKWQGNAALTWTKGVFSLTPNMRWVGGGKLDADGVTAGPGDRNFSCPQPGANGVVSYAGVDLYQRVACGDPSATVFGYILLPYNHVGSYFLFNLNATLTFEDKFGLKNIQLYANVDNVFNRAPPLAGGFPGGFGSGTAGTNPILYDTIGMATRVGFRLIF